MMVIMNIRFRSHVSLLTLVIFLVMACEFEPSGDFFKEVTPPDGSAVVINLDNIGEDTIAILQNTKFTFAANTGKRTVLKTNVFMNGQLAAVAERNTNQFNISSNNFPEGTYVLKLEMHCSSGTGSLADKKNLETIIINRQWVAVVDKAPPTTVNITSITVQNGVAEIRWQKYLRHNFQAYILEKQEATSAAGNSYWGCWSKEITDRDLVTFTDNSYVGGNVRYRIKVKGADKITEPTQKDFTDGYDPSMQYEWLDTKTVKLTWRKPRAHKGFGRYELVIYDGKSTTITKSDPNDTTYTYEPNVPFGAVRSARLTVFSAATNCFNMFRDAQVRLGVEFPSFYEALIAYSKPLDKYFAIKKDASYRNNLVRIDGVTMAVEQSFYLDAGIFGISANGQYLYATDENALYRLNPLTFQVVNTYDLSALKNKFNRQWGGVISVSNNNTVALATTLGSMVLRMSDFTIVYEATEDYNIALSPGGNYLVSAGKIWQWNGNSFDPKMTISGAVNRTAFKDDEKAIVVTSDQNYVKSLILVDLAGMTSTTTNFTGHYMSLTFDPESGYVGYFKPAPELTPTDFHLLSPSLALQKTIGITAPQVHYSFYTLLINNHLICSEGYAVPLSSFP